MQRLHPEMNDNYCHQDTKDLLLKKPFVQLCVLVS